MGGYGGDSAWLGNSKRQSLFRQSAGPIPWAGKPNRPGMAQPQSSGGMRPPAEMKVPTGMFDKPVATTGHPWPQSSGGMRGFPGMNEVPQGWKEEMMVDGPDFMRGSQAPANPQLEQTRQWLNRMNQTRSPMAAREASLFSTPTSYGNSSAEDWLRTYG